MGTKPHYEDGNKILTDWLSKVFGSVIIHCWSSYYGPSHMLIEAPARTYWRTYVTRNDVRVVELPYDHQALFISTWLPSLIGHPEISLEWRDKRMCAICNEFVDHIVDGCQKCKKAHVNLAQIRQVALCVSNLQLIADVRQLIMRWLADCGTRYFVEKIASFCPAKIESCWCVKVWIVTGGKLPRCKKYVM